MSTGPSDLERTVDHIKGLEERYSGRLDSKLPYVVRLDGVAFRNLTKSMQKPFDARFTKAMIRTCSDIMEKYSPRTGFCQSDEITLIFGTDQDDGLSQASQPSEAPDGRQAAGLYNLRLFKIISVLASFTSVRFTHHLQAEGYQLPNTADLKASAIFDCRAFSADYELAAEALSWRHSHDCRRNAIQTIGFHKFGHKKLLNMPLTELISLLKSSGTDPFSSFPKENIYGVFFKKSMVDVIGFNPVLNCSVTVQRMKVQPRVFDWTCSLQSKIAMVQRKTWISDDPPFLNLDSIS